MTSRDEDIDPATATPCAVRADTTTDDQLAEAREHVDNAYFYADGICRDTHKAVDEIDAALRLLHAARQRLITEAFLRQKAMLDQYDAFDTYRANILAAVPPTDHRSDMCVLAGCHDHRSVTA
jgi:hypothetical protein